MFSSVSQRGARDSFASFGLPAGFAVDAAQLDARFHRLMQEVHPDRHASGTDGERRRAMQWASSLNQAYAELSDPLARARCLCAIAGAPIDPVHHKAPPGFLVRMLAWREELEELEELEEPEEPEEPEDLKAGSCADFSRGSGSALGSHAAATSAASQRSSSADSLRSPSAVVATPTPTPTPTPSDGFVRLRNEALALRHSLMESFAASPVGRDPRQAVPSEAQAAAELVTQWMMVERFLEELAQRCEVPISASHVAPIRSPDPPARAHPV